MSIEMARDALLWCAVINYGVLLVWFLFFILARDFMHRLMAVGFNCRDSSLTSSTTPGWESLSSA